MNRSSSEFDFSANFNHKSTEFVGEVNDNTKFICVPMYFTIFYKVIL